MVNFKLGEEIRKAGIFNMSLLNRALGRPTGVRKVMGSIPTGDSDFFFVPCLRHVECSIFSYFFSKLKVHHLSLFETIFFSNSFMRLDVEEMYFIV